MSATGTVTTTRIPTPAGDLRVAVARTADGQERLVVSAFDDHFTRVSARVRRRLPDGWTEGETTTADAVRRYVAGDVHALDDVEIDVEGTPFQRRVWEALRSIPAGTTWSYRDLAASVGSPGAVRAVGSANGANPVWVAVPCHRVVRSDGSLGGYGGGLDRKAWLLEHERAAGHNGGEPAGEPS